MALSSVKRAFTSKPSYVNEPNAGMLAEMCRKATAKDAFQPDANMKQLVCLSSCDTWLLWHGMVGALAPLVCSPVGRAHTAVDSVRSRPLPSCRRTRSDNRLLYCLNVYPRSSTFVCAASTMA